MSEELLQEETTMADLEEHFDDANPWNVVQSYMENKTILPVKVEGIRQWRRHCYGRRTARLYSSIQAFPFLY